MIFLHFFLRSHTRWCWKSYKNNNSNKNNDADD